MAHCTMGAIFVYGSRVTAHSRSPRDGYPSRHDGFQEHAACRAYNRRIAHTRGREIRMKTVNVTVRMERQTRDDAAKIFSELGISTTQAINMFLKQAVREQRIPLRGLRKARPRARQREYGKVSTRAHRVGRRSALTARPAAISWLYTFDRSEV